MFMGKTLFRVTFTAVLVSLGFATAAQPASVSAGSERFGVFAEPLIAAGAPTPEASRALTQAVDTYRQTGDTGDTAALEHFLITYPRNPWRASLWLNIGLAERTTGRFSDALGAFAEAQTQASGDASLRPIAVRALSEQLTLETRLGHPQAVTTLLKTAQSLGVSAKDSLAMSLAEQGLWDMQHHPQTAFQCGWMALRTLWQAHGIQIGNTPTMPMDPAHPGYTLQQLVAMSEQAHQPMVAIHRDADSVIPVPSVVHWKSGHFATILARANNRYEVVDPTVEGGALWMTEAALHAEGSGYFLVSAADQAKLAVADRAVSADEARLVYGAGTVSSSDPHGFPSCGTCPCSCGKGPSGSSGGAQGMGGGTGGGSPGATSAPAPGMPTYNISPMLISLSLSDTPLSYVPPKGPAIDITLSYNQLDGDQPTTFTYGNVGPKWTHNWLSYVQDNPGAPGSNVLVYLPSGPGRLYSGFSSSTGAFAPEPETGAQLVEVSSSPIVYERRFQDGSKDVYAVSDNSTVYPRHIFQTQRVDTHGNVVQLAYDSQSRLATLTDALGQVVTFNYGNTSQPLLLTSVSDAFGRTTTLSYDSSGRLSSITDAIGMTSSVGYDSSTSVTSLTTPYGATNFVTGQSGTQRWINVTDPNGNTSRMEFNQSVSGVPYSESQVPNGINAFNLYINSRDSFYWDAQAYKQYPSDYTKALIYHWNHLTSNGGLTSVASDSLESIKFPLENRIWYNHPNDIAGGSGTLNTPTLIGRVLSDGTTQLTQNTYNTLGNLLSETDPSGLTTTYTYAANQLDVVQIGRTASGGYQTVETFTYDNQHDVLSHTDETGAVTQHTYNTAGQLLSTTDALGHATTYSYNAQGYLQSMTDANAHVTTYGYDAVGRLASVTDPLNRTTQYSYDALNRLVQTTYPDSSNELTTWNKLDIGTFRDRNGHATAYTYDGVRDRLSSEDPLGNTTTYAYYPNKLLQSRTDANGHTTTLQRDLEGRVTSVTDARSYTTSIAYDAATDVRSSLTNPLSQITNYTYDVDSRLTRLTDINGVITDITYSPRNWPLTHTVRTNANGTSSSTDATTTLTYDAIGDVTGVTDPDGVATSYSYDADHRRTAMGDALGNARTSSYDAVGNLQQLADFASKSTSSSESESYTYDAANEQISMLDAYAKATTVGFDVNGRIHDIRDPLGYHTVKNYDAVGNLTSVARGATDSGAAVAETNDTYDADNRLIAVTDPDQLSTQYTYDAVGQALQVKSPDTGTTTNTYDVVGNLTSRTDARGVVTQYSYDGLKRLTKVHYPANSALDFSYGYDSAQQGCYNNGHLVGIGNPDGPDGYSTSWCYTNQGDISQAMETTNYTEFPIAYSYTPGRRVTSLQYPSGFEVQYGHDADGRVNSMGYSQPTAEFSSYTTSTVTPLITSVSYLPFGPVSGYSYAQNGQSVTRGYDANYRLTDLVGSGLTLHFLRDAKGRIEAEGNSPGASPTSETYQYDPLDRVTALLNASGSMEQSFTYNATGDRLNKTVAGQGAQTYVYTAGTHQLSSVGGLPRSVDAAGNTTAMTDAGGALIGLGYDQSNHLTAVTSGSNTIASYQYNGLGQRVLGNVTEPGVNPVETEPVYDPTGTGNMYGTYFNMDINTPGVTYPAAYYNEYVYLDGMVVASATADAGATVPSTIHYLYADHLGTLRAAVTTAGTKDYIWPWLNNAFGDQLSSGSTAFNIRFPGQYYDVETGLMYNGARYYDSARGGFDQPDPSGFNGGIDLYVYGFNSPLMYVDPTGLSPPGVPPPMGPFSPEGPGRIDYGQSARDWAFSKVGQGGYGYFDPNSEARGWLRQKTNGIPSEKCNKFVWDALNASGDPAGRMSDGRIPSASEWGNPNVNIPGYDVVPQGQPLQAGDIVSNGSHVGIYSPLSDGSPGTVSAAFPMSSWAAGIDGNVVNNDWGFRQGQTVTIRRSQ